MMVKNKKKCTRCFGFGIWAIGDPCGVGEMDARDGVPIKKCPECGAKGIPKNSWRTLSGEYIKIPDLDDDHLANIIAHISEREDSPANRKILNKMLDEQARRGIKGLQKTGSVGGRINTRKWGSKREDKKLDQHNKKKKWQTHVGLKRTKLRWNKKKGAREKSKKGSRDRVFWSD